MGLFKWVVSLIIFQCLNAQATETSLDQRLSDPEAGAHILFVLDESITDEMEKRIDTWLKKIARTPSGYHMLLRIANARHPIYLVHSSDSLRSAGKSLSPATTALMDGRGVWARIEFAFDMPETGSHLLYDCQGNQIEWPAIVNFYHELSHAAHAVWGTTEVRMERQAMRDENQFREELAAIDDTVSSDLRCPGRYAENERVF